MARKMSEVKQYVNAIETNKQGQMSAKHRGPRTTPWKTDQGISNHTRKGK